MFDQWGRFLKVKLIKMVEFWLPKSELTFDERNSLLAYSGTQIACFIAGVSLISFMTEVGGRIAGGLTIIYAAGVLVSLLLMKMGFVSFALVLGFLNANMIVVSGDLIIGHQSSMWVYLLANTVAGVFFVRTTNIVRFFNGALGIGSAILLFYLTWFELVKPLAKPGSELFVMRFSVFNKIFALSLVFSFMGHFHRKMMDYRAVIEEGANALREQLYLVSRLLNNMRQAVFAVDKTLKVVPPVSDFSKSIFFREISGQEIFPLIFDRTLNVEQRSQVRSTFDLVFDEDELQWQISKGSMPTEVNLELNGEMRTLKISYSDMRNTDQVMEKLMFVVEDVTELRQLEKKIQEEKDQSARTMSVVAQIYTAPVQLVASFFKTSTRLMTECVRQTQFDVVTDDSKKLIKRNLHTIKGNARGVGFTLISGLIHQIEGELQEGDLISSLLLPKLNKIDQVIEEYRGVARRFGELTQNSTTATTGGANETVTLHKESLNRLQEKLRESVLDRKAWDVLEYQDEIARLYESPLASLFHLKHHLVEEVGTSLQKSVQLIVTADFITLPEVVAEVIDDSLTHLLRNAIDHGIETTEERLHFGKSTNGTIKLNGYLDESNLVVEIVDDGRGLDPDKLVQRAVSLNLVTSEKAQQMTPTEKMKLMVLSGFSTRQESSEYSGRGVGLDVVMDRIQSLRGSVEIESELHKGTSFKLNIPLSQLIEVRRARAQSLGLESAA